MWECDAAGYDKHFILAAFSVRDLIGLTTFCFIGMLITGAVRKGRIKS